MKRISSVLRKIKRISCNDYGQSIVEFALLLPVFLMLVMGVIDIARAYSAYQVVTNSAREGARLGIIPGVAPAAVTTQVTNFLAASGQAGCAIQGTNLGTAGVAGSNTQVAVSCNFTTLTGTLIPGWTGTIVLARTVNMRHE
jgi:Flp pilus assembly protein TadG